MTRKHTHRHTENNPLANNRPRKKMEKTEINKKSFCVSLQLGGVKQPRGMRACAHRACVREWEGEKPSGGVRTRSLKEEVTRQAPTLHPTTTGRKAS